MQRMSDMFALIAFSGLHSRQQIFCTFLSRFLGFKVRFPLFAFAPPKGYALPALRSVSKQQREACKAAPEVQQASAKEICSESRRRSVQRGKKHKDFQLEDQQGEVYAHWTLPNISPKDLDVTLEDQKVELGDTAYGRGAEDECAGERCDPL